MNKVITAIVAVGLAVAFTAPTMAAEPKTPTTKASCLKAKMHWDGATKTCTKSNM
jgi:hypothetical protein